MAKLPNIKSRGYEPDIVYPPTLFCRSCISLSPYLLEVFCSVLAPCRLGRYAVTECYKRYL